MRLIAFVIAFIALNLSARGATGLSTPVLTNFYAPHFIVAPNAPPTQIIKSRIFGPATNIFNLTTNIYNNSYFVESNVTQIIDDSTIIITNTTINITNVTFIVNGQTNDITQLWRTNAQGIYFPAITNTATIVVGQNAETWWSPTLADGFVSIHDASVGDSQFNSMAIAAIDNVLQENYGTFTSTLGSGAAPAGAMQLLAATNWQNPSAPFSKFSVALQPAYGEVLLDLMNNGVHEFSVSNQITSVQALQLVPLTNITLGLGANQINVQSNSYVALQASFADPTTTEIDLSTGLRDGMLLLLKNIGVASGFTLFNGSPLYDDPTKYVTLSGGNWATTNYGESILLSGGINGWSEVKRFGQDTNILTEQLWANSGGTYYPLQSQTSLLATNIFSYQTLQTYGALKLLAASGYSLVAGDNNIDPTFTSLLKLTGFDADPTSTTLHLGAGSGVGQFLYLLAVTNSLQVLNGDPLFNDPTKYIYLSNGDWKPTNRSEMLSLFETPIGWMEIGRSPGNTNTISGEFLWELVSGHMRTVPDTLDDWQFRYGGVPQLTISTNGGIVVGTNSLAISAYPSAERKYLNLSDISKGDLVGWEIWHGSYMDGSDTLNNYSIFDVYGGTNDAHLILNSQGASSAGGYISLNTSAIDNGEAAFGMSISNITKVSFTPSLPDGVNAIVNLLDTVYPITTPTARLLVLRNATTNQFSFGPDARIWFGEGGTNALYRRDNMLVYTNSADADFRVVEGANYAELESFGGNAYVNGGTSLYLRNKNGHGLITGDTSIQPTSDDTISLSGNTVGNQLHNLGLKGTYSQWGFYANGGTDYSRMDIQSTGTNVWNTHQFNSISTGTAGTAGRPFQFTNAPVMLPYVTKAEKTALSPLNGELVYQTDNTPGLRAYINGAWVILSTGADP